jgi:hypothetical protein
MLMGDDNTNLFGEPLPRLGAPLFAERWSNRKAFWIGVYAGQGLSAPAICQALADGIQPNTVTGMLSQWGFRLPTDLSHSYQHVRVPLSAKDRTRIAAEAKARDLDVPSLCARVLEAAARESLWRAILDA